MKICGIYCKDLGEILVVGIDKSTSQISKEALEELKEIFAIGKPIILVTHVPFNSQIDNGLSNVSKENRENRNLTWDYKNSSYIADDNTKEFLDMLYSKNSPVKAVLCGHLHLKYTVKLNENITEYVFKPAFSGSIALVKIVGDK